MIQPIELPLAGNGGLVACRLKHVSERFFLRWQIAEVRIIPEAVLARHDLHARRRADRRRVTVIELNAALCERVDVWCLIVRRTVSAKALPASIVRHDENDVGLLLRGNCR